MFTNICLWTRTGSELALYDLTRALLKSGHHPMVFSPRLGALADEIRSQGVAVFSRLDEIPAMPDLIHGSHRLETLAALRHFPTVPGLFVCHDRLAWHDEPPRHTGLRFYVAVDFNCRERLLEVPWMKPSRVKVIGNSVDTDRFRPRSALPVKPRMALVFSNSAAENSYLEVVREACQRAGLQLDVVGAGVGYELRSPETVLPQYDVVFAKARCALEAMAVGTSVILCDSRGLGPMVTSYDVEELRRWNFGMRLLAYPLEPEAIVARISQYDCHDARAVCSYIRKHAALEKAVVEYLDLYSHLMNTNSESVKDRRLATQKLRCRDQALLRLKLSPEIEEVRPGQEFFLQVRIRRLTLKPVATESPWPSLLSYRWLNQQGENLAEQEGLRSLLLPPVPLGFARKYDVRVVAPWSPGQYRLRVTLVQEHWRWLDEQPPKVFDEVMITVTPRTGVSSQRDKS